MNEARLNPAQHQAVTESGACLVVACPGSGKTRLLVSKAAWLLNQDPAHRIVAVTFTREAALELKARISEAVGEEQAKRVLVGTFHSLCLQQLKLAGHAPVLLSAAEQEACVQRAWELAGKTIDADLAARVIEHYKTDIGRQPDDSPEGRLVAAYTGLMARNRAFDFQDLLLNAVRGMRAGTVPAIPATHLFVDEFQDTDAIQYAWLREHSRRGTVVTVVGDDDQCQPAETQVLTHRGPVPIAALDPARDTLLCHDGERLVNATRFRLAQRRYHGPLIRVQAGGRSTLTTPDHFWRVRWRRLAGELFTVQLLRRGESWRLCAHRLLDADGACVFGRATELDADAVWVLQVCADFSAALAGEAELSLRFQLPLVWTPHRLVDAAVARCLASFRLDAHYPLWSHGELLAGQFRCRAMNLLPEWMEVPVTGDGRDTTWYPLICQAEATATLDVWSLAVEPHPTYVADGLVTGNCIYSWRHAMGYDGMLQFESEHGARRITLGANYRCRSEILESAGHVISYNSARMDKELVAAKGAGGDVRYQRFVSRDAEAEAVADAAADVPDDWAVLARTNRQLDIIEGFLSVRGIPCTRTDDTSLWDKRAVSFFLSLLRSISGDGAPARIDQLLHWAGVREDELVRLHQACGANLTQLPKRLGVELSAGSQDIVRSFADLFAGWQKTLGRGNTDLVIVGACQWMAGRAEDSLEVTLLELAAKVLRRIPGALAARIALVTGQASRKERQRKGVALLTLHGAKGLEFDRVWLIGAEETVLPNEKSMLEEERRLMYVGMTRARDQLVISSTDERPVSRFVAEATLLE